MVALGMSFAILFSQCMETFGVDYLLRVNEIETKLTFILTMMSKYNIPE